QCHSYVLCTDRRNELIYSASRFVDFTHVLDFNEEDDFFSALKSWFYSLEFASKPVVYFTNDTYCYLVNIDREWFEVNCILCLPSSDIVSLYSTKGLAENAAMQSGLKVPKTVMVESEQDLNTILRDF